jgi:hypothetical protein
MGTLLAPITRPQLRDAKQAMKITMAVLLCIFILDVEYGRRTIIATLKRKEGKGG